MQAKRGFTLIEILVAVTIFSFAMITASGIFSNIVGNQSLVAVSSDVNREGQRILRQISDDTINAVNTGSVAVKNGGVITVDTAIQPKGILFLDDSNAIATPSSNCVVPGNPDCNFNGVVLFTNNGIRIYRFVDVSGIKTIQYGINLVTPESNQLLLSTGIPRKLSADYSFSTLNNNSVEFITNGFSGISCYNSSCSQAPFIRISITTETKDYVSKAARHRAKIDLRTMITGRSY